LAGSREGSAMTPTLSCSSNLDMLVREREKGWEWGEEEGRRRRRCGTGETLQQQQMGGLQILSSSSGGETGREGKWWSSGFGRAGEEAGRLRRWAARWLGGGVFFIQWLTVNDVQDVTATKHNDLVAGLDNLLVQRSVEVDFIYIFVIF
jgi:hypothetical protein